VKIDAITQKTHSQVKMSPSWVALNWVKIWVAFLQ